MANSTPIFEIQSPMNRDPVPLGVRIGDVIYASGIAGIDPATGRLGEGLDRQFDLAFANLRTAVEGAGGSIDNIGHVTFFTKESGGRAGINRPWLAMFPDENDRPTYKFMQADLPGDRLVQLQAFAVAGSRRQLLNITGVAHGNPIPLAVKVRNYIFTSRILPTDPATGKHGESPEEQARLVFQNMATLLEIAGAEPPHVSQVWLFVGDPAYLKTADEPWAKLFGGAGPTRHPIHVDLPGHLLVMAEFTAVVG